MHTVNVCFAVACYIIWNHEMIKVLLMDNVILKTYLADVTIGCSNLKSIQLHVNILRMF